MTHPGGPTSGARPAVAPVRLRQVVVITSDLPGTVGRLRDELGLGEPFQDVGVGFFGLENRVLAAGDCFVEVLTPIDPGSAGRRYLDRRGSDGGYMALFQLGNRAAARDRAGELGIRVAWQGDVEDETGRPCMSGTHLDPRDVPGAIVSLDWADPPGSWHWAGPAWRGKSAAGAEPGGVVSLTVAVGGRAPEDSARIWAEVLGGRGLPEGCGVALDGAQVHLTGAGQRLRFVEPSEAPDGPGSSGIVACELGLDRPAPIEADIAGVRFSIRDRSGT